MPKKKEPELTSEKQFKRFQEAAKEREIEKRLPKTEQDFIELAKKGFFVEPSSAVAYAAHKKQLTNKEVSKNDEAIVVLTGTGLKTMLKPN